MEEKGGKKINYREVWQMIKPSVRKYWYYIPFIFVFAAFQAMFSIAEPYIFGSIIDVIVNAANSQAVVSTALRSISPYLLAWAGILIFGTLFDALLMYTTWRSVNLQIMDFLGRITKRIYAQDLSRFENSQAGSLLKKIDKAWDGYWRINDFFSAHLLRSSFLFLSAVALGFWVDWRLALVALIPVPIIVGIGLYNIKMGETVQDKINEEYEKVTGRIGDTIANIATVKSFNEENRRVSGALRTYSRAFVQQMKINHRWSAAYASYGGTITLGRLLIFVAGTIFVVNGTATVGVLVMFLGFAQMMLYTVLSVMNQLPYLLDAFSRMNRMRSDYFDVPKVRDQKGAKSIKIKGSLEFKDVTFAYPDGKQVLSKISFSVQPDEVIAMVGESGAGKSTLAKMMLRFHEPQQGEILIDGREIRDIKLKSLRSQVGFVMQENLLFHETVLNNIKLANRGASRKQIEAAARKAQAHKFIKGLPKGYDTIVGERGVKLSGGEKQRIAIARVFLENPPILVLDEATSALDSKTEHELQAALKAVMKGRTTLVIAHRLSTIMSADKILVVDKGKIVDSGTHEELIKRRNGLYKEYWQIQAGGYE